MIERVKPLTLIIVATLASLLCITGMITLRICAEEPTPTHTTYARLLPWGTSPAGTLAGIQGGVEAGNRFEGFGCANWSWGRYDRYKFAVSFTTHTGGELATFWLCWKTKRGYGAGNLGTWNYELQTDHPKSHVPSGTVISRLTDVTGQPDGYYRLVLPKVKLQPKTVYHLVMYNTDPEPSRNWSSPNTLMSVPETSWQGNGVMSFDGQRWAPWGSVDNPVNPSTGSCSAYLVEYTNGTVEGMPYYSATRRFIYASRKEGEQFPWTQEDSQAMMVAFPIFRVGKPAGGVSYVLEDLQSGTSATGLLATTKVTDEVPQWCSATLTPPMTLKKGRTYRLSLQAPDCVAETSCYGIYVPYSSERVPGWPAMTWGKEAGTHVAYDKNWGGIGVPADMSFSLIVKAL